MSDIMNQIDEGVIIIEAAIKGMKKPANKKALEDTKETIGVIKKQYKAMSKDESIRLQYEDKVAYSVIQLMFQVLHLAILSGTEEDFLPRAVTYIKESDSVYTIAERIKNAAEARADFGPVRKGSL